LSWKGCFLDLELTLVLKIDSYFDLGFWFSFAANLNFIVDVDFDFAVVSLTLSHIFR
jgi:hypothetical protein